MNVAEGHDIVLPVEVDRASVAALRAPFERAPGGTSITLDGSRIERVETAGVQLLCALVLAAEGRGVVVVWTAVPELLVVYVGLLGIGDVIQLERPSHGSRGRRTDSTT